MLVEPHSVIVGKLRVLPGAGFVFCKIEGVNPMIQCPLLIVNGGRNIIRMLTVTLGSPIGREGNNMFPDEFIHLTVQEIGLAPGMVHPAIASFIGTGQGDAESRFHFPAVEAKGSIGISVAPEFLLQAASFSFINSFGHNINGTSNRRQGEFGSAQSTLHLNTAGNGIQPEPVGPVNDPVFHVVYRHPVEQHTYIPVIKSTD